MSLVDVKALLKKPPATSSPSMEGSHFLLHVLIMYHRDIQNYLNLPEIRTAIGIDPATPKFDIISMKVNTDFAEHLDGLHPTYDYVAALLDRGVRVLIYVGRNDWICNHLGNEAWTTQFEWSGHDEFASQPLREWIVDGRKAGFTRKAKGLMYVSVDGAGHMVRRLFFFINQIVRCKGLTRRTAHRCLMINPRKRWSLSLNG